MPIRNCNYCCLAEVGPKKILDLMNVPGLTRENVASHLQVRQISYSNSNIFLMFYSLENWILCWLLMSSDMAYS
jgi:hypothetical protein